MNVLLGIARFGFLALLVFSWLPCVARVIQIYVVTRFPEANRILPVDGRLFGEFLVVRAALAAHHGR